MSVIAEVFSGLSGGVLSGIGELAIKLRTAITGSEAITGEKQGELLLMLLRSRRLSKLLILSFRRLRLQLTLKTQRVESFSKEDGDRLLDGLQLLPWLYTLSFKLSFLGYLQWEV